MYRSPVRAYSSLLIHRVTLDPERTRPVVVRLNILIIRPILLLNSFDTVAGRLVYIRVYLSAVVRHYKYDLSKKRTAAFRQERI